MRDPRDPDGQYEREDGGFGFAAQEGAWGDKEYIEWATGKRKAEVSIGDRVREIIKARERVGMEQHRRPFTKDTYEDNLQEAIEEIADALFYLVAERERRNSE